MATLVALIGEGRAVGYAKHVGRVGALAIALGVGIGISATPGVAWADETGTATPSDGVEPSSHRTDSDEPTSSPRSPDVDAPNDGESLDGADEELPADDVDEEELELLDGQDFVDEEQPTPSNSRDRDETAEAPSVQRNDATTIINPDTDEPDIGSAVPAVPAVEVDTDPAPTGPSGAPAVPSPEPAVSNALVSKPDAVDEPAVEPAAFSLSTVLAPLLGTDGPGAPVDSPALWLFLAAARRQFTRSERTDLQRADAAPTTGLSLDESTAAALMSLEAPLAASAVPVAGPTVGTPGWTGTVTGKVNATDPDGDKLAYRATSTAKGKVTVTSRGTFTYTPTAAARHAAAATNAGVADKTDTFTITVDDGKGNIIGVPITVTIKPANTAPASARSTVTVADPVSGVVTGRITATDRDKDTFTYTATTPGKGIVTVNPDGTFTYNPSAAARITARSTSSTDTDKFSVTISDGHGGVKTLSVSVKIAPANTAPVSGTPTFGTPSSTYGTVKGSVNAKDPENDSLRYSGTAKTASGKVTVSSNGSFTYTPTAAARHAAAVPNGVKTDTFTVAVKDKYGAVTNVSVTVSIHPKNASPTAKATYGQPNPTTGVVTGTVTGTDSDRDTLTFTAPASTGKGTVVINANGTFTYTPTAAARHAAFGPNAPASATTDTFSITASDGHGGTGAVSIVVTIVGTNSAPGGGSFSAGQPDSGTGVVTGTAKAVDADNDTLTYTGTATTAKGSVVVNSNGTFTYTPTTSARHAAAATNAPASVKTDTFVITAADGYGGTTPITVSVSVGAANATPTSGSYTATTNSGTGVVTGTAKAVDADNDTLTYTGTATTAKGTVVVNSNGTFTYTPTTSARHAAAATNAPASVKTDTFVITAADGYGGVTPVAVTVSILGSNNAPTNGSHTATTNSSTGVVTGTATAIDSDNDSLTYSGSQATAKGAVVVNPNGTFTYTPTATARHAAAAPGASAAAKIDSFVITVSDGHGATTPITVNVAVLGLNSSPANGAYTSTTNSTTGAVTGTATAIDADNDTLTYSGSTSTAKGTVVVNSNGTFTYTPTAAARHRAAAANAPAGDKIDAFVITASDGYGANTTITVNVAILGANAVPSNGSHTVTTDAGTGVVSGTATAADADNDTLTYSGSVVTPKGAVVVNTNGTFTYTPTAAARHRAAATNASAADKTDTFTISAIDGHGGITPIVVTVTVVGKNSAPSAATATVGTPNPSTAVVTGTVTAADSDNDTLTYSAPTSTGRGTVTVNSSTGSFTYTPTAAARDIAGASNATASDKTDVFTVTVSDGHGGITTKAVTVVILGSNRAPENVVTTISGRNPSTGVVTGRVTATDPDGDALTYGVPAATSKGSVTINASTGVFTYTPTQAALATAASPTATSADKADTFVVTITDGKTGGSATKTVSVPLVNTAPLSGTPSFGSTNTATGAVSGALNARDIDGNPLSYSVVSGPANGSLTLNTDGTFTYTPTQIARLRAARVPGAAKTDTFIVSVSDGQLATNVTVTSVPIALGGFTVTPVAGVQAPGQIAINGDGTRAYVVNNAAGTVTVINTTTNTVVGAPISVGQDGFAPQDIVVNSGGTRAYVTDSNAVRVIDLTTGTLVGSRIFAGGAARGLAISPDGTRVYVAAKLSSGTSQTVGQAVISIIDTATNTVIGPPILIGNDARIPLSLTVSPDGTKLYAVTERGVSEMVTATRAMSSLIATNSSNNFHSLAFSPDGSRLYVAAANGVDTVTTYNVATKSIIGSSAKLPYSPQGLVVSPDGRLLYIAHYGGVSVIDAASLTILGVPVPVVGGARYIAMNPNGTVHVGANLSTVSFTGVAANKAPLAGARYLTGPHAVDGSYMGSVEFTDEDGDTLYYSGNTTTSKGSVTVDAMTGALIYTPTYAARHAAAAATATIADKQDTFYVTANDAHGNSTVAKVVVQVLPGNKAPIAPVPLVGTPNATNGVVTGTIFANDDDGDPIRFTAPVSTAKGTLTVNATTGAFVYTPNATARHQAAATDATAADKTDTFVITASDNFGGATTITVDVAIGAPVNQAPVAGTQTAGTTYPKTGEVVGAVSFTDADGDTLTFTGTTTTAKGSVAVTSTTGAYVYTPTAAARHQAAATDATTADKTDSFTITAIDGHGGTKTVTVNVTISPANVSPVVGTPNVSVPNASGVVTGTVVATDADNDALRYSAPASTTKGTVTVNATTGAFTYTPTAAARNAAVAANASAAEKSDTFTVTVSDGHGAAIPVTVTVSLVAPPANRAPAAGTPTVGAPNTGTGVVTGTLNVTDPDGNVLTYTVTTGPVRGKVTVTPAGIFTYTPSQAARLRAAVGLGPVTDTFTVTVSDGQASITTTVTAIPVVPGKANAGANSIALGTTSSTIRDGVFSPDGTRAYYVGFTSNSPGEKSFLSIVDTATNSVIGQAIPLVGGRPSSIAVSRDGTRLYVATDPDQTVDAGYASGTGFVTVISTVTNSVIGDPIRIVPAAGVYAGKGLGSTNDIAVSSDGTRVYVLNTYNYGFGGSTVAVIDTGTRTVIGEQVDLGYYASSLVLNNDGTRAYVGSTSRGVAAINTATKTLIGSPISTGGEVSDVVLSPDGTRLYAVNAGGPNRGSLSVINTATNTLIGSPIQVAGDPYRMAFSPDGTLAYVTAGGSSGTLSVVDIAAGAAIGGLVPAGYYPYRVLVSPDGARIYASPDFSGRVVSVIDFGAVPNDPPIAGPTTVAAPNAGSGAVSGTVAFTDGDGDTLTYSGPATTAKGTLTVNSSTGAFIYTPSTTTRSLAAAATATAADRMDSFVITANDGHGHVVAVTVNVAILPAGATPNGAPRAGSPTILSRNPSTGVSTGTLGFYDYDNDSLTYIASTQPSKGSVSINPTTGAFTYTPTAAARHAAAAGNATDQDIRDSFTVLANDGHGNITPVTVNVLVGMQNIKPVLGSTTIGTPNASTGVVTGKVTATDPDNDAIVYVGPTTTGKGTVLIDRTTGAFTYTPAEAARAYAAAAGATAADKTDTFTITAYDNHGDFVSTLVTVTISTSSAVNRPPEHTKAPTVGSPDSATGEVSGNLNIADLDRDGITFTFAPTNGSRSEDGFFIVDDGRFTVDGTTGAWTFVPSVERRHEAAQETGGRPDYYSFRWTATDGRGASISGDITVPITPLNQSPTKSSSVQTRNPSTGAVTGTFTASDGDGDYLDVSIGGQPGYGTATAQWLGGTTYQWTYKPTAGQTQPGTPTFSVQVSDGHGGKATEYIGVNLQAPSSSAAPVVTGLSTNRPANPATGAVNGTIAIPNSAGRDLVFTRTTDGAKGTVTVDSATGAYTYTPSEAARQNSASSTVTTGALTDSFTVRVTDGDQIVDVLTIYVPISALNRRPSASVSVNAPNENGSVTGAVTATDPDGDTLFVSGPAGTRLGGKVQVSSNGSFTYTADPTLRAFAAKHADVKDYFVVTITETSSGRKTYVRVPVAVPPATFAPTPTDPPRYPPPPPGSPGSPGNGGSGTGGSGTGGSTGGETALPTGPDIDDITKNPHRITGPISGLNVSRKLIFDYVETIDGTAYVIHYVYSVTVKNPTSNQSTNPANNGDIYVIQVVGGKATGYTKLIPGQEVVGIELVSDANDLYGCSGPTMCVSTDAQVQIVSFAKGYFPTDLFPGGGTPPGGPAADPTNWPYDGYNDAAETGIVEIKETYKQVACMLPAGASIAEAIAATGPKGKGIAAVVANKFGDELNETTRDALLAEDVERARDELRRICSDGV